jgi:hypothetical protein
MIISIREAIMPEIVGIVRLGIMVAYLAFYVTIRMVSNLNFQAGTVAQENVEDI